MSLLKRSKLAWVIGVLTAFAVNEYFYPYTSNTNEQALEISRNILLSPNGEGWVGEIRVRNRSDKAVTIFGYRFKGTQCLISNIPAGVHPSQFIRLQIELPMNESISLGSNEITLISNRGTVYETPIRYITQ